MLDPNAIYAPNSGVQVFSANTMSLLGEGLVMNHQGIGNHAICNKFNHTALNVRCSGGVISNETEPYDTKTVALDAEVLRKLHTTIPLKDLLGIKGKDAKKLQGNFGTQQVGSNVLAFIIRKQTSETIANGTDPKLIRQIATETSRMQTNATVYNGAAKGGKLTDAHMVLPKESN